MGLPPATRIEDDRETLARCTRGSRTGWRTLRRPAALAALVLAVAAAGVAGQRLSPGPRASGSPSSSPEGSSPVAVAPASSASPASLAPGGIVPDPMPTVVPVTAGPSPTEDTGGLPQIQPPLYSLRSTQISAWRGGAGSGSGSRIYTLSNFGIGVIDTSGTQPQWVPGGQELTAPFTCSASPATMAGAGNRVIYSLDAPATGPGCGALQPGWHFELADSATGSVHEVKAVVGTVANVALPPSVAISSDVYAFAYEVTTFETIVEVHALSTEKLLWSTTLTGQVDSLAAGGSRILISLYSSASTAGAYPGMTQLSWMDASHHDPLPLGVALGTASLSQDGSTAAWFDAAAPGCHSLDVENLDSGDTSSRTTLSDETQARSCQVAVDVIQGQTTVAWTPTDIRGPQFVAISYEDGTAYELVGLPRLSWISLQGRTLTALSDSGPQAISIDLDLAYTAKP